MLILTRKKDEQIRIVNDIVLTVVEIRGGKVQLGIECPRKIPIRRSEVPSKWTIEGQGLIDLDDKSDQVAF